MVVYSGRTVEQAIEKGLKDLNLPRMKAHIKVISREKKGFLGFGKKPARVSVEPINEKITHEANQNTVKVAPDAIKQLDDSVASPKDETIAFNKVTKLVAVSDNKEIAHEDLKQPVSTETLDEELPDKKQEQPKATIIPLSVKRESSEGDVTEFMANSLEPQLEPVAQVQTPETSEGDFSSFVASEFSSDESSENNLEDIQGAADDVLSYLEKIIYEMDVDASTETLIDLAEKTAAKVKETGREYVMDPMTNSERKIIHKALSQIEGVESHSEGDDPNRYVVVTKV